MNDNNNFPINDDDVVRIPINFGSLPYTTTPIVTKTTRKCSLCKETGHDKRTCPHRIDEGRFFSLSYYIINNITPITT